LKPGFALAVILTLGLGIGANATMFGIVDRLLFRPPAYLVAPERATRLYLMTTESGRENESAVGYRRFVDFRDGTTSFDAMTPYYARRQPVGTGEATKEMLVGVSTADLWRMFDIKPALGRFFTAAEDVPPAGAFVTVLSYAFWQTEFGGRTDILGTRIAIGPAQYTIIGVAPEGFSGLDLQRRPVAFVPISAHASMMGIRAKAGWSKSYSVMWFDVYARRKPGISLQQANTDLTNAFTKSYFTQAQEDAETTPIAIAKPRAFAGPVLSDRGSNKSNESKVATWLLGVAGIVLLIACANVANLMLARVLRRRREIAVRIALGISRSRLLTQLLTESLLLALLGGITGLALAQWGGAILRTTVLDLDASDGAFNDPRVLVCVASLAAIAGLLTGVLPAFQAGRTDVTTSLKARARDGTVQRSHARAALLIAQAALSVVLLVGAGLFVRSLQNVKNVHLGYDTEQVLWVNVNWRGVKLDSAQQVALRERLLERAQSLPSVEQASRAMTLPFSFIWSASLFVSGIDSVDKLGEFTIQAASPTFFATMGTRLLRGRGIMPEDRANTPQVMVVSQGMAKRLWPNEDAIGKCIRVGAAKNPCRTIVGITEDVRRHSLSEPELHYYMPIEQWAPTEGEVVVRTRGPAVTQAEAIRRSLQALMPEVSYVTVTPMETIIGKETRSWRLGATMFTVFGGLALVLAAIGLYSVIAYNVTQRTHEMGVRVALGARGRDVIGLVVREGLVIVIPGVAVGAGLSLYAGRWIAPLLFDVSPTDLSVMASVVVTLIVVATTASWLPALRAARVDPSEALRSD
jgi:predicted permease